MQKPLILLLSILLIVTGLLCFADVRSAFPVNAQTESPGVFRVGERITYNISLGRFPNVAYAETHVVSRGKLAGKEVYEILSKLKTINIVAIDLSLADAVRTAFVSPVDGTPIIVKNVDTSTGAPTETSVNYTEKAPASFDLSTILFKIRASGGSGSFQMYENERQYGVTWNIIGNEIVRTDAGDFPTNIVDVQSGYLTEHGITDLKINISTEESAIPVQFRAKTAKGELRALVASIQVATPEPTPTATPVLQIPRPTPKPSPTAAAYVENQPLNGKPFSLGESLEFTVKTGGRNVGTVVLSAKERKLVAGKDSLILNATVSNVLGGDVFRIGNGVRSNVDPDTLSPFDLELKFDGPLAGFNQSVKFSGEAGKATVSGGSVDIPIGTHNILSLIYAMRQFNLNPSRDSTNPINDTRVAVFWMGKPNIFTLRPAMPQQITIGEQKVSAQQIAVTTGNPQLDSLGLKVWLSNDARRIPLRFVIGSYQLDLNIANIEFQP